MNELGALVVGAGVRGTVFVVLGVIAYAVFRRRGGGAGSFVALSTLLIMSAVSLLSLCSWPRWWTVPPVALDEPGRSRAEAAQGAPIVAGSAAKPPSLPAELHSVGTPGAGASVLLREVWQALQQPPAPPAAGASWGWPAWCVVAVLAGSTVGLVRLALGLRQVQALRVHSRPIDDVALCDLADLLRAEASWTRPVVLRESAGIATPATVGWLHPVILLPEGWRAWDEHERRVVLAHELAHVHQNDYLSGVLAQLSVCLHFYHPLAHWLMGRLRLEQELAADSAAARLAGGNPLYLTTLAQMALRQADQPVSWPARAFLPIRGTFLRRIEMLRDATSSAPARLSRAARVFIIGSLCAAGVIVVGFCGPEGPKVLAQPTGPGANSVPPGASADYTLDYVPAATDILVAARPAELLAQPALAPMIEALKQGEGTKRLLQLPLKDLDQALVLWLRPEAGIAQGQRASMKDPTAVILHSARPLDQKAFGAALVGDAITAREGGQVYYRDNGRFSYAFPDDRTMIVAPHGDLHFILKGARSTRHSWDDALKQVDRGPLTVALSAGWLAQHAQSAGQNGAGPLEAFAPLWTQAQGYAASIKPEKGLAIDIAATCTSDDGAVSVQKTARALLTLATNLMEGFHRQIGAAPREAVEPMQAVADIIDPLLEKAQTEHKGRVVHVRSSTNVSFENVVKLLLPAVQSARVAANRSLRMNNLKQLAIAMHNYHDVNGKLPPAVLKGPDGKTTYSWRIALLPYLEQQTLYKRYKFDEPWDGPNNRKLLDEMPAVFGNGTGGSGHNSVYFVLTGPDTMFGVPGGARMADITDGTSNTIMIVEAKRDVPWTKPEDIPIEANAPLPAFGGLAPDGYNACFGDGSVRFLKSSINPITLRALLTRAGGEVISSSSF